VSKDKEKRCYQWGYCKKIYFLFIKTPKMILFFNLFPVGKQKKSLASFSEQMQDLFPTEARETARGGKALRSVRAD
jgi:hypothetical protein